MKGRGERNVRKGEKRRGQGRNKLHNVNRAPYMYRIRFSK
jgi:hypothetical protein